MKNKILLISALALLTTLASCATNPEPGFNPGGDTPGDNNNNSSSDHVESPSFDGGLEGNEDQDNFTDENNKNIEVLLENASKQTKFTYEVTVNVSGTTDRAMQYYTPNAWYTESDTSDTFGYAQTKDKHYLFKYYLSEDEKNVYPSIYEYSGYTSNEITTELYSALTVAHISQLADTLDTLKDEGYSYLGGNRYVILDDETMSVFQFMSSYGMSIANYINAFYIQIIDLENCIFETTLDLGMYGTIKGKFTPQETTKIDFVNDAVLNKGLEGVKEYSEVKALNNLLDQNNFTMRGIYLLEANGYLNEPGYTIYCTNDYFAFLYDDPKYADFGFALIKANTTVPVYSFDETGNLSSTPTDMTMDYDACYEFRIRDDGSIYFMNFIGPVETESTQYKYVDSLPTIGEVGILYITEDENGKMMVYEWAETEGKYQWKVYSEWYDTVGDFYVSGASATFYLSSSVFTAISASLYEKADPSEVNELDYVSSNTDILSALANGIFGWGYQPTTTWMDYITKSYLTIEKEGDTIKSANIGLGVMASLNGGPTGEQKIYYNYTNFGSTSFKGAEDMISSLYSEE